MSNVKPKGVHALCYVVFRMQKWTWTMWTFLLHAGQLAKDVQIELEAQENNYHYLFFLQKDCDRFWEGWAGEKSLVRFISETVRTEQHWKRNPRCRCNPTCRLIPDPKLQMSFYYSWDAWGLRHNVNVFEVFEQVYISVSLDWITLNSHEMSHLLVPACFNAKWYRTNKVSLFLRRLQRSCDFHCLWSGANVQLLGCGRIFAERIFTIQNSMLSQPSIFLGKLWKWHSWNQHIHCVFWMFVSQQIGKQNLEHSASLFSALSLTSIATTTRLFNLRQDQRDCQGMSGPSGGILFR